MSPARRLRYRTPTALAAAVLVAVSFGVGASALRGGPSPDGLVGQSSTRFRTVPPGGALPTEEECAREVRAGQANAHETVPANLPFNRVRGDQRLPPDFFTPDSGDPRANQEIASRVTGNFAGTTAAILEWAACKWGIDERYVRAQADMESSFQQSKRGDWSTDPQRCAPGHGLGEDGRDGQCPESFGLLQVRYVYFPGAFPAVIDSTAFNIDTAYAVWRACYEGYEWWLRDAQAPGHPYQAGSLEGCIGRWFSGAWFDQGAQHYVGCVQRIVDGRPPCP